jgi:hypothetical protein
MSPEIFKALFYLETLFEVTKIKKLDKVKSLFFGEYFSKLNYLQG